MCFFSASLSFPLKVVVFQRINSTSVICPGFGVQSVSLLAMSGPSKSTRKLYRADEKVGGD